MALREVIHIGNPVLRKKAKKVEKITPLILQLIEDMAETMYDEPGIGLAAPQVGVSKRVIVVDVGDGLFKLINPKITSAEGTEIDTEGCLSVPGKIGEVERYAKIGIKAMDPEGKIVRLEAEGLFARCLQHEIDHLDGILFVDKAENIREPQLEDLTQEDLDELDDEEYEEALAKAELEKRLKEGDGGKPMAGDGGKPFETVLAQVSSEVLFEASKEV